MEPMPFYIWCWLSLQSDPREATAAAVSGAVDLRMAYLATMRMVQPPLRCMPPYYHAHYGKHDVCTSWLVRPSGIRPFPAVGVAHWHKSDNVHVC